MAREIYRFSQEKCSNGCHMLQILGVPRWDRKQLEEEKNIYYKERNCQRSECSHYLFFLLRARQQLGWAWDVQKSSRKRSQATKINPGPSQSANCSFRHNQAIGKENFNIMGLNIVTKCQTPLVFNDRDITVLKRVFFQTILIRRTGAPVEPDFLRPAASYYKRYIRQKPRPKLRCGL